MCDVAKEVAYSLRDSGGVREYSLDKLVQLDQNSKTENSSVIIEDMATLAARANAKFISDKVAIALVNANRDSFLSNSYQNSTGCATAIKVENGETQTKYCKNRWCMVCNRIRTAKLLHTYYPIVKEWGADAFFTTVTIPNVKAGELQMAFDQMHEVFTKIKRRMKRTLDMDFVAIRKIECTYNPKRDDYHPHYHIIFKGQDAAETFKNQWLKYYPGTSEKGQDVQQAKDGGVKELFKYFTKLFAKNSDGNYEFDAQKMDVIFKAMYKKRTMQPYGFKKSDYEDVIEETDTDNINEIEEIQEEVNQETETDAEPLEMPTDGIYLWRYDNWYHYVTGEALTNFEPTEKMLQLVKNIKPRRYYREMSAKRFKQESLIGLAYPL